MNFSNKPETRMHSSRMRTVRCSVRLGGGGVCLGMGCLPRGLNMIVIMPLASNDFRCRCRECAPVGGGESVHCCHHDPLYWNSVRTEHKVLTHNTPSLCVTQHPAFTLNYLNVANLEKHFPHLRNQQTSGKFKSRFRYVTSV